VIKPDEATAAVLWCGAPKQSFLKKIIKDF
jgi:hypothetical protein